MNILNSDSNQISKLPETFERLTALKKLNLKQNSLNLLPQLFGNLTSLRDLILKNNNIEELPDSIGNLKNLIFLARQQFLYFYVIKTESTG